MARNDDILELELSYMPSSIDAFSACCLPFTAILWFTPRMVSGRGIGYCFLDTCANVSISLPHGVVLLTLCIR